MGGEGFLKKWKRSYLSQNRNCFSIFLFDFYAVITYIYYNHEPLNIKQRGIDDDYY